MNQRMNERMNALFLKECLNFTMPFQPSLNYCSVIQEHFFGFIQLFRSKLEFLKHGTNTFAQGSRIFPSKKEPAVAALCSGKKTYNPPLYSQLLLCKIELGDREPFRLREFQSFITFATIMDYI